MNKLSFWYVFYMFLASFEQVMQAIDRKIPISKSALYSQYALPEPIDDDDAFVREDSGIMLSDSAKKKSYQFY